ncbi:hypothetical protein QE363_001937 [Sphingomonas sp. SORGH_AS870]|uniref:hypothetical protein n=1 Tax=Sphingomonas sp. SORGH_AS_0870 TaxID=3041801 RepID=UPI002858BE29|nr:hypothetical protein [Sphingomonas sp. SORGH_AS_0870]MDR6146144.1 hypothetical protein [Sphingomonas sp. SORGH_AS_0870]
MNEGPDTAPTPVAGQKKELRDWLNVIVAFCALIVSIVSLWTTIKVSGLEDYFQSEIVRRNAELKQIAARSDMLESVATARSERLSEIQSSADSVMSRFSEAQQRLILAQADLSKVRSDAALAAANLADAKRGGAETAARLASQANSFDLFIRANALDYASLSLVMRTRFDEDAIPSGKSAIKAINALTAPAGQRLLQPYLDRIKVKVPSVCPMLNDWKATIPDALPEVPKPTITYMSNASKQTIDRLTREAQSKYMTALNEKFEKDRVRREAEREAYEQLDRLSKNCMCKALADEKIGADQICPATS